MASGPAFHAKRGHRQVPSRRPARAGRAMSRAGRDRDERNCRTAPLASHACSNVALPTPARPDDASAGRALSPGRTGGDGSPRLGGVRTLRGRGRPRQLQRTYRSGRGRCPPRPRRAEDHQGLGRTDGQQRLPAGVPRHRRGVADRRGERAGPAGGAGRRRRRPARAAHLVTTHRHYDHWQALGAVAGMFGTRQIAHPLDAPELPMPVDEMVEQGDTVRSARSSWRWCTCAGTPRARSRWSTARRRAPPHLHGRLAVPRRPRQDRVARRTSRR